jgi:leucyl aminopeptidase
MLNLFKSTNIYSKSNIDKYIFVICNNFKQNIKETLKLLNILKPPKTLFNDYKFTNNFEKTLYTDKYEIIFIGIVDEKNKCSNENLFNEFGRIGRKFSNENNKRILIKLVTDDLNIIKNQLISYILGFYEFIDYKSNHKNKKYSTTIFYHQKKKYQPYIKKYIYEAITQNEIRSLINTPANLLTSTIYAKYIKNNINSDIKIKILNESQLKKIGCNLIIGVNQGSKNKPYMIILEYKRNPVPNKTIALIGKGVMFDSGGYNIKIGNSSDMKNDMTGSAIVYAIFKLLSENKVNGHFVGLLPLVENMVDANSIHPGDILKSYNGKTVEIIDTDAEGRLIMADALGYSKNYNPYLCIDIATLTGQAAVIFDSKSSVIMGNNNKYIQKMIYAGKECNEKIWELPMWKEYVDLTKSNIADFKNYTFEAKAGTIMAGAFLSNFVPENTNWIHLDIAGVDNIKYTTQRRFAGATGEIMRSLFYFLENINKEVYEK